MAWIGAPLLAASLTNPRATNDGNYCDDEVGADEGEA
jgi:hypothetical protein